MNSLRTARPVCDGDIQCHHQATATHSERDIVYGKLYLRPLRVPYTLNAKLLLQELCRHKLLLGQGSTQGVQ